MRRACRTPLGKESRSASQLSPRHREWRLFHWLAAESGQSRLELTSVASRFSLILPISGVDIQLGREVVGLADVITFALVLASEGNHIGHGSEFDRALERNWRS